MTMHHLGNTIGLIASVTLAAGCAPDEGPSEPDPVPTDPTIEVSPMAAPAGSEVTVRAEGFPPGTEIEIGFGPPQSWYDDIVRGETDAEGRLHTQAPVPALETGREYVWVAAVTGVQNGARAVSEPFVITAGESDGGSITIRGEVTDEGVECPAVRSAEERSLYTLVGAPDWIQPGDRVRVEGSVAEMSICQQGTTIEVTRVERL